MNMNLGSRLRYLRKQRGMTLATMTRRTGLSLGYLSKLENGLTSPTIAHLQQICDGLDLTLHDVLSDVPEQHHMAVIHQAERRLLSERNDGGLRFYALTKGCTLLQATAMEITDDMQYDTVLHSYDQFGVISSGVLEISSDDQTVQLSPGDSIYLHAGTLYRFRRATDELCVSYWVRTAAAVHSN